MIESIQLTDEQIATLGNPRHDWLALTAEQQEMFRTQGPERLCAIVGNQFVRMPTSHLEAMCEHAFKAAEHQAILNLGIVDGNDIAAIQCNAYSFGQSFVTATVTHHDGRTATASGELVIPANAY